MELQALAADENSGQGGPSSSSNCSGSAGLIDEFSRPGSSYVLTSKHPPRPGSSASGNFNRSGSFSRSGRPQTSQTIDILAEGNEGEEGSGTLSTFGTRLKAEPPP